MAYLSVNQMAYSKDSSKVKKSGYWKAMQMDMHLALQSENLRASLKEFHWVCYLAGLKGAQLGDKLVLK